MGALKINEDGTIRLWGVDFVLADILKPVRVYTDGTFADETSAAIHRQLVHYELGPGDKHKIRDSAQFQRDFGGFYDGDAAIPVTPGGSTSNVFFTVASALRHLGYNVDATILTAVGEQHKSLLVGALEGAGVKVENAAEGMDNVATTLSDVYTYQVIDKETGKPVDRAVTLDGETYTTGTRCIVTQVGSFPEIITPELIDRYWPRDPETVIYHQGSMHHKLQPGLVSERIWQWAERIGNRIIYALPTTAFNPDTLHEEIALFQRRALHPQVLMVVSNEKEIGKVYPDSGTIDGAVEDLWRAMLAQNGFLPNGRMAVVTQEALGADLVLPRPLKDLGIKRISTRPVQNIATTLGAGDTATAGVIIATVDGYGPEDAVAIANRLAGKKLLENGARLSDPGEAYAASVRELETEQAITPRDQVIRNAKNERYAAGR